MNQTLSETFTDSLVILMFLGLFEVKRRCTDENYKPLNAALAW
jgi:hypothetical protein